MNVRLVPAAALTTIMFIGIAHAADQVVTDPGDSGGANQLRAKLAALQSTGGGRLSFDVGFATIVLTQGVLANITTNCMIDGGDAVTVSGNDASRVFIVNAGATLTLNHITVSHGNNASGDGGAIRNDGILNINNCKFLANQTTSSWSGGAILSLGPLNITNSEFALNQAGNAGAIYPRFSGAVTNISSTSFHDNATTNETNGWGGAMLIWDGAPVNVTGSTFTKNSAALGGAIYVFSNSTLSATDTTFDTNSVRGHPGSNAGPSGCPNTGPTAGLPGYGGAVYNGGSATLTRCTLTGNAAFGGFGGYGGTAIICPSGNVAYDGAAGGLGAGGAIYNSAVLALTNCTLSANGAAGGGGGEAGYSIDPGNYRGGSGGDGYGGAIYNAATVTLGSCTIAGNSAGGGGGGNGGSFTGSPGAGLGGGVVQAASGSNNLRNNLIATNNATASSPDAAGAFTSQGYNLIGKADGSSGFSNGVNHDLVGTIATPGNPMLDPNGLANNGGPTATVALLAGSPAINAGTASGAPPRDQRGFARNGLPDIGAFEFGGTFYSVALGNISTRGFVGIGDEVMIGGFIINGTGNKTVLMRAIGPSLANPPFNLSGTLQDPTISLFGSSGKIISNDNWADAANAASIDPNLRPSSGLESAILVSLAPGAYTAIVRGANGGTGIGLVEVFDLDATVPSKLSNISTRGLVETGDSVMIGGFIVKGPDSETVVVRAIGPSLANPPFNLTNVLQNPTVSLFNDQGGVIQSNDDWQSDQRDEIAATGLQPSNTAESAIVRTLTPGNYTAIVTGVNGTTGIALVEVYGLN
jgi:hypothetical protein